MDNASYVFSGIRKWACETLNASDACWLCVILSDLSRYVYRLEDENKRLREVADLCSEYIEDDRCEGCIVKHACYNGDIDDCFMRVRLINIMRELGIEV